MRESPARHSKYDARPLTVMVASHGRGQRARVRLRLRRPRLPSPCRAVVLQPSTALSSNLQLQTCAVTQTKNCNLPSDGRRQFWEPQTPIMASTRRICRLWSTCLVCARVTHARQSKAQLTETTDQKSRWPFLAPRRPKAAIDGAGSCQCQPETWPTWPPICSRLRNARR